jgi:hypothetical protein
MPFALPTEFQKELAVSTQKLYKGKLNALAAAGFATPESLVKNSKDVIKVIKELTPGDDEKARTVRRYFLSGIFWVAAFPKTNPYYTFWKKSCMPLKVAGTETDWVDKKKL